MNSIPIDYSVVTLQGVDCWQKSCKDSLTTECLATSLRIQQNVEQHCWIPSCVRLSRSVVMIRATIGWLQWASPRNNLVSDPSLFCTVDKVYREGCALLIRCWLHHIKSTGVGFLMLISQNAFCTPIVLDNNNHEQANLLRSVQRVLEKRNRLF